MTTTATITFRKTKSGEWAAFGPADAIRVGEVVITKRSGETVKRDVERVGKAFLVDGVQVRYGYLAEEVTPCEQPREGESVMDFFARKNAEADARPTQQRRSTSMINGWGVICDECGKSRRNLTACLDSSGISGMCCPRCASGAPHDRSFA